MANEMQAEARRELARRELARRRGGAQGPEQSYAGGIIDSITKGATFGLAPKITALEAGVLGRTPDGGYFDYSKSFGDRYDAALDAEREQNKQFETQNPVTSTIAEIGGGIGSGGALLKGGLTATRLAPQGFVGQTAGTAADAAAMGASYAYGADGDVMQGAKEGAMFGVGGKLAGDAIGGGYNKIRDVVASRFGAPDKQALARANNAMRSAGMTTGDVRSNVAQMGPEATALDVMGPSGYDLARSAANISPQARAIADDFMEARMAGQPDRLMGAVERATGNLGNKSVDEVVGATQGAQRPAINRAYESARQAGFVLPPLPDDLAQRPAVAGAFRKVNKDLADKYGSNPVSALDYYDEVKKVLDDLAGTAYRQGQKNKGNTYRDLAKNLRQTVDNMLPGSEYTDARGMAQKLFKDIEAIEMGANAASGRRGVDIARNIQSIPDARKPYARQGYGAQKAEQIFQGRGTAGKPDQYFGSAADKAVMEALLTPQQKTGLQRAVGAEKQFGRTQREIQGNSSTARQLLQTGALTGGAGLGASYLGGADPSGMGASAAAAGVLGALARKGAGAAARRISATNEANVSPLVMQALLRRGVDPVQYARLPDGAKAAIARSLGVAGVVAAQPN